MQDRSHEPQLQAEWNDICARYHAEVDRQLQNLEQMASSQVALQEQLLAQEKQRSQQENMIKALAAEQFFHKDYEATLVDTYGLDYEDSLVLEGGGVAE